jgi:hypothetical protein
MFERSLVRTRPFWRLVAHFIKLQKCSKSKLQKCSQNRCFISSRKFQIIWIFWWYNFWNLLFIPNTKIMETKNIPQCSTFCFKTTINWTTFSKKSEFLFRSINSGKSLNGRITRYLSLNGIFKIRILSQKLFLRKKFNSS